MVCKRCSKCKAEKPTSEFHRSSSAKDGLRGECRSCRAQDRQSEAYRKSHRESARRYRRTPAGKETKKRSLEKFRLTHPDQIHAVRLLNSQIEHGKLYRKPCEKCGAFPSEAHHPDYAKPLEVVWLCQKHHKERHRVEGTGPRKAVA